MMMIPAAAVDTPKMVTLDKLEGQVILIRFADRGLVVNGKPDLLLFRQLYWVTTDQSPTSYLQSYQYNHTKGYPQLQPYFTIIVAFVIFQSQGGVRHLLHPRDHHVPAPPDVQRHIQTVHSGIFFHIYFFSCSHQHVCLRALM